MSEGGEIIDKALALVVTVGNDERYRDLRDALMPYLAMGGDVYEITGCILLDMACNSLRSWVPLLVARVDVLMEFLSNCLDLLLTPSVGTMRSIVLLMQLIVTGNLPSPQRHPSPNTPHTHTHPHVHHHIHTHTGANVYTYTCLQMQACTCMHACACVCVHALAHTCAHAHTKPAAHGGRYG